MFPPKPLDIFSPEGGCLEGLDMPRFFLNNNMCDGVLDCLFYFYCFSGVPAWRLM